MEGGRGPREGGTERGRERRGVEGGTERGRGREEYREKEGGREAALL